MFTDKYTEKPAITMTPEAQISGTYWISDIEPDSFTINLSEPQDTNVNFSWHAFARKGVFFPAPASSANVQPVAETQPTPDNTAATSTDSSQIIPEASSTPLVETATPETPAETTAPTATPEASVSETAPDTSSPTN